MKAAKQYDARLEDWVVVPTCMGKGLVLKGIIFADKKKRFKDGAYIFTSDFTPPEIIEEGTIIQTRNTLYMLGRPLCTNNM